MAFWTRFFGSAGSQAAGFAIGATAAPALLPAVQYLENEAWSQYQTRPPDAYVIAQGVAQGQVDPASATTWAHEQGLSDKAFSALVAAADTGPAFGNLMDAYRRALLTDAQFNEGLHRLAIESQWWPTLRALSRQLLTPNEAANARQQGYMSAGEQHAIAREHGLTDDDAETQFLIVGLPPGPATMQEAVNRGLADQATFAQAIREGHTKTKYTDLLYALRNPLLSAATYTRAFLKGWISRQQMHAGGALWGYTPEQMDLWELTEGRPATVHQIHIGYARGSKLPGATDEKDAIYTSVKQSDIRPEYADLLYAQRYTYPSAFVLRSLVQSGAITQTEGEQALLFSGWEPTFAEKVAASWAGSGTGTSSDPHIAKAQTQLWTTTHASYKAGEADETEARAALTTLTVPTDAQDAVLALWNAERELVRKQLTPAQIKKAYREALLTHDDASARLIGMGYSLTDATTFLSE